MIRDNLNLDPALYYHGIKKKDMTQTPSIGLPWEELFYQKDQSQRQRSIAKTLTAEMGEAIEKAVWSHTVAQNVLENVRWTIMQTRMSPDLGYADFYLLFSDRNDGSPLSSQEAQAALKAFKLLVFLIRKQLASKRFHFRLPHIRFFLDQSYANSLERAHLINQSHDA